MGRCENCGMDEVGVRGLSSLSSYSTHSALSSCSSLSPSSSCSTHSSLSPSSSLSSYSTHSSLSPSVFLLYPFFLVSLSSLSSCSS